VAIPQLKTVDDFVAAISSLHRSSPLAVELADGDLRIVAWSGAHDRYDRRSSSAR
jgi:hypothetical protein